MLGAELFPKFDTFVLRLLANNSLASDFYLLSENFVNSNHRIN
jgi:hypothetical protein